MKVLIYRGFKDAEDVLDGHSRPTVEWRSREKGTLRSFAAGLKRHGHTVDDRRIWEFDEAEPGVDLVLTFALRPDTRRILTAYSRAGARMLMLDKGMIRDRNKSQHSRVMLDIGNYDYLSRVNKSRERLEKLGDMRLAPPIGFRNGPIVYAGNSQKVHDFWGLGIGDRYAQDVIFKLRRRSRRREVYYRPKPSSHVFPPIAHTVMRTDGHIEDLLAHAHSLVTFGSCCAINAIVAGVPAVCLGPNPASPVSSDNLSVFSMTDEGHPALPFPTDAKRMQWLANLAWGQWTKDEFASGEAWEFYAQEIT